MALWFGRGCGQPPFGDFVVGGGGIFGNPEFRPAWLIHKGGDSSLLEGKAKLTIIFIPGKTWVCAVLEARYAFQLTSKETNRNTTKFVGSLYVAYQSFLPCPYRTPGRSEWLLL